MARRCMPSSAAGARRDAPGANHAAAMSRTTVHASRDDSVHGLRMMRSGTTASLVVPAAKQACGTITLPGSKSISNRTLLLAALAEGTTTLHGLLDADDVQRMREALVSLGVTVQHVRDATWQVTGAGGQWPVRRAELFLGNAGTAFRPLTAVLALSGGDYTLRGVARMHERPIGDLVDALARVGADVRYLGQHGYPPLAIAA